MRSGTLGTDHRRDACGSDSGWQLNSMLDGFSLAGWRHDWRNMDDGEDRLVTGSTASIKDGEMKIEYQLPWVRLAENCLARLGQRAI